MRFRGVDLPSELIAAQKAGSLAVFAGAGVSRPFPSNYPDFEGLAQEIAGGIQRRDSEPLDQFLGRLVDENVPVHKSAKRILSNPNSVHNRLHTDLLRLFESAAQVRIVTTNFDRHFTSAARSLFDGVELESFFAPALPLGDSFSGIAYLHGSVEKDASNMVLTDRDFGRAYLTEGWARRFLQRLFLEYVVIFVGYSHNDIVLTYLARGLPPASQTKRRFAFVQKGQEERWVSLGITPITYQLEENDRDHIPLAVAIEAWGDWFRCGLLEHEKRMKAILERPEGPPPTGDDDLDYIGGMLDRVATAQYFARYANAAAWLRWAEKTEAFRRLFSDEKLSDIDLLLAQWFAENYAAQYPEQSLAIVRRHGGRIGPALWIHIGRVFNQRLPAPETFGKWLPVLVKNQPTQYRYDFLDYILVKLGEPDYSASALILLEHLTRPELNLKRGFSLSTDDNEDNIGFEISARGNVHWVDKAWAAVFMPNLPRFADALARIASSNLEQARLLFQACGKAHDSWDEVTLLRQSIAIAREPGLKSVFDTLIDIARDVLLWYIEQDSGRAEALIEQWFSSSSIALKRIAVFGAASNTNWPAEEKIFWLLRNELLYMRGMRSETMDLLDSSYGLVPEDIRSSVLERVAIGPPDRNVEDEIRVLEILEILHRLHNLAPQCALTKARLDEVFSAHPELNPANHPQPPITETLPDSSALLSKSPNDWLDLLVSYEPKTHFSPSREMLARNIEAATSKDFDWSRELAQCLGNARPKGADIWHAVAGGWIRSDLSPDQWTKIFEILVSNEPILHEIVSEACSLLRSGMEKEAGGIPLSVLPLALDLSELLWSVCTSLPRRSGDGRDWIFSAINHPAGVLMEFWLAALVKERQVAERWEGLPSIFKRVFALVAEDQSYSGGMARVVLASRLHILFLYDEGWAIDNCVRLLTRSNDRDRDAQIWQGFLFWGKWSETSLPHLLPCYEGAISLLPLLGEHRGRFCNHLASIALLSSIHPVEQGWLARFLRSSLPEDRASWAGEVRLYLQQMKEPGLITVWQKWMCKYWQSRIDGLPVHLSGEEAAQMAHWSLCLEAVFPEVVEKVCAGPAPNLENHLLYFDLVNTQLPEKYPEPFVRLLAFLLQAEKILYDFEKPVELVRRAAKRITNKSLLRPVCEQLAALRYPDAGQLLDSL